MCAQNHINFDNTVLSLDMVKKIEPFFITAEEVTLFGYGEPLLNPHFADILIHLTNYPSLKTYLLTNGVLLPRFVDLLVRNHLTYLSISIDAATEETYQKIRRGGRLSNILNALDKFKEIDQGGRFPIPYLRFIFVAMKDNIQELPELVTLANRYGVKEIKVEYLVAHSEELIEQSLFFHQHLLSLFSETRIIAEMNGVKLNLPPLIGQDQSGDKVHKKCHTPRDTFFLSSNGDVRACMISNEIFGNIHSQSAEAIWADARLQRFRKQVNSTDLPADCQTCWQASHLNVNRPEAHIRLDVKIAGQGRRS
jgi:radical SAM protein with 4Fe4S-binding SPASM domain